MVKPEIKALEPKDHRFQTELYFWKVLGAVGEQTPRKNQATGRKVRPIRDVTSTALRKVGTVTYL
jgi:hypothetical protein